jgi:hypothetical protein
LEPMLCTTSCRCHIGSGVPSASSGTLRTPSAARRSRRLRRPRRRVRTRQVPARPPGSDDCLPRVRATAPGSSRAHCQAVAAYRRAESADHGLAWSKNPGFDSAGVLAQGRAGHRGDVLKPARLGRANLFKLKLIPMASGSHFRSFRSRQGRLGCWRSEIQICRLNSDWREIPFAFATDSWRHGLFSSRIDADAGTALLRGGNAAVESCDRSQAVSRC